MPTITATEPYWHFAEHTWDCPCRGSRLESDGQVIGGPAKSPLAEVE
jgi:Rieske Fe-S protein